MDLWFQVRRYVLVEGHSKRSACKAFGLNWRTMQKMLDHAEPLAMFNLAGRPHLSHVYVAPPDLGAYGSLLQTHGLTSGCAA